jgi:hypothetical protein
MQILFADESERDKTLKNRPFFCIAGLCVEEEKLRDINDRLNLLLDTHGLANLKETRTKGLNEATKLQITEDICTILSQNSVVARAIIIGDSTITSTTTREQKYMSAFFFLIERWYITLRKNSASGLMIFDMLGSKAELPLSKLFYEHVTTRESTHEGKSYGKFKNHIYPTLLFSPDENCPLLQVADLIGVSLNSAVTQAFKKHKIIPIAELPEENPMLKTYWQLFLKSPGGRISGWGIKMWN